MSRKLNCNGISLLDLTCSLPNQARIRFVYAHIHAWGLLYHVARNSAIVQNILYPFFTFILPKTYNDLNVRYKI